MLDIHDMFEKDKVLCLVKELKSWAKAKFYKERVKDNSTTYTTTVRLFDLSNDQSQDERWIQTSTSGD